LNVQTVTQEAPDDPRLAPLIAAHATYHDAHYPAESNHHQDGADLAREGTVLFVGWHGPAPVGMAGYKPLFPRDAELKSMFVLPEGRAAGLGSALLARVIAHARAAGHTRLYLETGSQDASAAARRLYERAGFRPCPPFGAYIEDPMSVFMSRDL
jgi:putative acetyltransferase